MNQVFMNLIANAIDVLEEEEELGNEAIKTKKPTIRISTAVTNNNSALIRIADNGPGMSNAVQSQLFEAFFTTKPAGKGTGLGLSISYQIVVEKHGGKLACTSTIGQGTEFTVEIPIEQP